MRFKISATGSELSEAEGSVLYDEFTLKVQHACTYDSLSLSSNQASLLYLIGSGPSAALGPTVQASISTCVLAFTLYFYDEAKSDWESYDPLKHTFYTSFDLTTGQLFVDTSDVATYDPNNGPGTVVRTKITAVDPYSIEFDNTVEDEFEITFKNECSSNKLTLNTQLTEFVYYVNSGESTPIVMDVTASLTTCTLVYELQVFNEVVSVWEDYQALTNLEIPVKSFDATTGTLLLETADFAKFDFLKVQVRLKVTAEGSELTEAEGSVLYDEFPLTVKDECYDSVMVSDVSGLTGTADAPYIWSLYES